MVRLRRLPCCACPMGHLSSFRELPHVVFGSVQLPGPITLCLQHVGVEGCQLQALEGVT